MNENIQPYICLNARFSVYKNLPISVNVICIYHIIYSANLLALAKNILKIFLYIVYLCETEILHLSSQKNVSANNGSIDTKL